MKQNLLTKVLLLFALIVGSSSVAWAEDAPDVTLDFTSQSNWDIPTSGTNTTLGTYTDGTNSIKLYATTSYKMNNGYLILGKKDSYLELPAFSFDVEKIVVVGNSGASSSVKQNIYVGSTAVSTETEGATGTNTYNIASTSQAAGTIFKLMVTSAHNTQITYIYIYKKKENATSITIDDSGITNTNLFTSTAAGCLSATVKDKNNNPINGATVTWNSETTSVATIASDGTVTLVAAGTTKITASYAGVEGTYDASSASYDLTVVNVDPDAPGTIVNPYTVAQARAAIDAAGSSVISDVYARGIVSQSGSISSGAITYYISDDGTQTDELQAYKGKGIDGANFTSTTAVKIGEIVVIKGNLKKYNTTYEFDQNNQLVSRATASSLALSGNYTTSFVEGSVFNHNGVVVTATYSDGTERDVTTWATFSEPNMNDVGDKEVTVTFMDATVKYSITITEKPYHTATFVVNGTTSTNDFKEGTAITFPAVADIAGMKFMGWTKTELSAAQESAPADLTLTATMGEEDITFYAVFAEASGTAPSLTKMSKGDSFAVNDKVVVVAVYNNPDTDTETSYGMYQETQSSSYVKNFEFTGDVDDITDDKMWWTVSAGSNGKWKLGDETDGYLYTSGSNNLSVEKNNSTEWTLEGNDNGTFKLKGGGSNRYVSCRSDLSGSNQFLFRMAGSTPAGVYSFDIYKYVADQTTYSNYCTSIVAIANITSAGYATYSNTEAVDFSANTDLVVYTATDNDTSVSLNEVASKKVPANTPVVLKGDEGSYTGVVISSAEALGANDLRISDGTTAVGEGIYVLAKKTNGVGFYPWTSNNSLSAGKIYLQSASNAPFLGFDGEGTTGIQNIERTVIDNQYYTLDGRRVAEPTKGLYIINGKKVVIK